MSHLAKKYNNNQKYSLPQEYDHSYYDYLDRPQPKKRKKLPKNKRNSNFLVKFICSSVVMSLLGAYGYFICPYTYEKFFRPLFLNRILNRNIVLETKQYISPTKDYINNSHILDKNLLVEHAHNTKELSQIKIITELTDTKTKLLELFKKYSKLEPSIFVWEYSTGSGFEINSDATFPSASIIKIPLVFELIRLVDSTSKSPNPISLTDKRIFSEEYRTLGSGNLQYTKADVPYTLDYLANITIGNSDNSSTNMLLNEIGGMDNFNRSMRNLGLKITSMQEWLPDLNGNNKTTAREISTILYNIDNPNYINPKYKNILKEYLGNTKNIHLIKEKLPQDVMVLHKTGNIDTMLGDSGIVYTNNGKKYIVTILVKRPSNDYSAKLLVQEASLLIYNDINMLP